MQKNSHALMHTLTPARVFLLAALAAALYASFKVIQPLFGAIVMAALIASLFQPVHQWILIRVKNRKNVAAFVSCALLVFVVLLPLTLVGLALVEQGITVAQQAQEWFKSGELEAFLENHRWEHMIDTVEQYTFGYDLSNLDIHEKIIESLSSLAKVMLDQSGSIAANLSAKVMNFGMMIFVFFFFIRDGDTILERILHIVPLSSTQEGRIIQRIKGVARSVLLGTLLTALAQGIAAGIGFAICGIPALFWGTVLAFSSLVPVIGTALIWVPAVIYLIIIGKYGLAVFLAIYCAALVGSIDNFLRPVFMKGAGGMSTFMIFLSVIGGIPLFGVAGILYGPLVFGIAWVLLVIYEIEFEDYLKHQDAT